MAEFRTVNVLPEVIRDVKKKLAQYQDKTVVWFGYTPAVDVIQHELKDKKIDYVVDNDRFKWGKVSYGGVITSPPEHVLVSKRDQAVVFILSNYAEAMAAQVKGYGYGDDSIVVFPSPNEYADVAEKALAPEVDGMRKMELRELQLCELEILKAFRDFCDVNGWRYYLTGGTCFGASYYKGFVPWDDDIDVCMPYDDYMAFVQTYPLGGRYEVLSWDTCNTYYWPYCQLADNETEIIYQHFPLCTVQGVSIDIVPMTGFPAEGNDLCYRWDLVRYLDSKWHWYYNARDVVSGGIADNRQEIWNQRYDIPFHGSPIISEAIAPFGGDEPWYLPGSAFEYGTTLEFEGERFSVMKDWKQYLAVRYRKLKGKSQDEIGATQVPHPIKAYWK